MEAKIKALITLAIIVILFLITIRFKIKSDKKRKSFSVPSETIKPKGKQPYLVGIPSAVLAIMSLFGASILAYGIGVGLGSEGFGILKDSITEVSAYTIYCLVIAPCCFFIVKENPGSVWYVPIICNVVQIIASILVPGFWKSNMVIPVCGGWGLSIIVSIIGAWMGKRKAISDNP